MGIAPYKTFTFDGVSSDTYGVYLTGEGVFNAPERSVEMIQIAGRNGDYALDLGKFNNITVTYKAGMYDVNESNFATKIANLRNWLCSKVGYCRLSDDYNPNEYRMGVYASGLEVDHEMLIAGEFELTFNCKPQRFLTSGETAQTITSGSTITNPTLFDARPQLQLWGVGTISLGGNEITLVGEDIGDVVLYEGGQQSGTTNTIVVDDTFANSGDAIEISKADGERGRTYSGQTISHTSLSTTGAMGATHSVLGSRVTILGYLKSAQLTFAYGTAKTVSGTASIAITFSDNTTATFSISMSVAYDGADTFTFTAPNGRLGTILLHSTQTTTGAPAYVDLDIGECYKVSNGSYVSINNAVTTPSKLPTLPSGATTITFDNTFTQVKIVPRWWQV